ncbi:Negative modulator of initiation of replication [Saliniradius amylolyticus]|uniref:Negative modulator of initiation of replication n=1 Tax=Saliniradius amylolyticus TaxID=2183582 RepID=A0A2S2E3A8_9ALTE|nr:replication initiation regulator SeqA [Saliniradius amylolyticus]AWL12128.1 Negative modulator of initiation of replication [Saliniradius amylolyticus]
MKTIEIDDDLYRYIAAQTEHIGESASQILRRLLLGDEKPHTPTASPKATPAPAPVAVGSGEQDIFAAISQSGVDTQSSRVERFLGILSQLAKAHGEGFSRVLELKGRNRVYFARSKAELLSSGSSTNPKSVPETEFWVVTNNNTRKKAQMVIEVARLLDYNQQDAQRLALILAPELKDTLTSE